MLIAGSYMTYLDTPLSPGSGPDRDAFIGRSTAMPQRIKRVFDVRHRMPVKFDVPVNNG